MAGYTLPNINKHSDQLTVKEEESLSRNGCREYGGLDRKDAERLMVQHAWGDEKYPEINKIISRKDGYENKQNKHSNTEKQRFTKLPSLNSDSSNHDEKSDQISKRNQFIKNENILDSNQELKKGNKLIRTGKKKNKVADEANTISTEGNEQEESPRDILARLTQRRQSVKQEQKNPAVWKKTGQPDTVRQPLGKHMMTSAEGKSGTKQVIENNPFEEFGDQLNYKNRRESRQDEKTGENKSKQRRQKRQPEINELGNMLSLGVNAPPKTRTATSQQPTFGEATEDSVWQNGFIPNVAPPVNNEIGKKIKPKQAEEEKNLRNSKNESETSINSLPLCNNDVKKSTPQQNTETVPKLKGYTGQNRNESFKHQEELNSLPNIGTHWQCIGEEDENPSRKSGRVSPVHPFHVKPSSPASKTPTNSNIDSDKRNIQNSKQRKLTLTPNKGSCHNVTRKGSNLPKHYSHVKVDRRSVFQMADAELAIKRRVTHSEVMALSMFRFQSSFTFSFFALPEHYKKHNDSILENTKYIGRRGGNKPKKIQRPNKTLVDTK